MKPAPFDYHRASDLADALRLLEAGSDEVEHKVIAGGQTLVPLMAMRLARPALLIDLNHVTELAGIERTGDALRIGAMTRQRRVEGSDLVQDNLALLTKALAHVGHVQTRNRGTVGGSLVHGDASAEIPLVAVVLGARLNIASNRGSRVIEAGDFFQGPMMTAIREDEILTSVDFPLASGRIGTSFQEVAPRHGDFALVSAAVQVGLDDSGNCTAAQIGVGGCGLTPLRLAASEAAVVAGDIDAAIAALDDAIDPENTPQASAGYRRRIAPELVRRALEDAFAEGRARSGAGT
jgi:CO/xanthine dehydrogenase FAD-binding subunit